RSLGEESYTIRFTPRKPRSNWSAVNVRRFAELAEQGLVHPAGYRAFEQRVEERTGVYAYENRGAAELDAEQEREFRAEPAAWEFFQAQPAGYRRTAVWWVVSAKREETRRRRLATLIADSARGRRIAQLDRDK
ncbi:MAG TPA: YdeI/OmpD-associated family protein, partial [Longimicrobiaceae bacterium]|nr:YdeI/OmpD-associated family protein [Longimicrobiaceae bacterium]